MNDDFDIKTLADENEQAQPVLPPNELPIPPQVNQVKIGIINEGGFVKVIFSQPIPYLNMTKKDAREFASRLVKASLK